MAKRDRATLKRFFKPGSIPNATHFEDLIDSASNIVEDLHQKISSDSHKFIADTENKLIKFYSSKDADDPKWSFGLDKLKEHLHFHVEGKQEENTKSALSISAAGLVGINQVLPQNSLDVGGIIRSKGRKGVQLIDSSNIAYADGEWHNITPSLSGCNAFEITAATGMMDDGDSAIVHGIAVNSRRKEIEKKWTLLKSKFGGDYTSDGITLTHSPDNSSGFMIEMRWSITEVDSYYLQIRTSQALSKSIKINYHMQQLWDDQNLLDCNAQGGKSGS